MPESAFSGQSAPGGPIAAVSELLVIEDKELCSRCGDVVIDGSGGCFKCSVDSVKNGMTSTIFTLLDFSLAFMLKMVGLHFVSYPLILLGVYSSFQTLRHVNTFKQGLIGDESDSREDIGLVRIMTYLAPVFFIFSILTGFTGTFFVSLVMSSISLSYFYNLQRGQWEKRVALPRSPMDRLRGEIRRTITAGDKDRGGILARNLLPKIEGLIDHKLASLKRKKMSLDQVHRNSNPREIRADIERLERETAAETDPGLHKALEKSLSISRAMLENHEKIEKMRRLYDVQEQIIVKILKNLNMKIATLNLSDGSSASVERDIEKIESEVKVIEDSFVDVDEILEALPED